MLARRFNVVTDGAWGSCGKGAITTFLAAKHKPEILSTTNMANAGHTAVNSDGTKFVAKALPSAAVLTKWLSNYQPHIVIGPTAAFKIDTLQEEIARTGTAYALTIHPRAGVITDEHAQRETDIDSGTKYVASTMQGCGAMLADKVMRKRGLRLAGDYDELRGYMPNAMPSKLSIDSATANSLSGLSLPAILQRLMDGGYTILHEGAQGFSLDINHGSHYPQCTSRGTTAVQNLADMGLPVRCAGDIYLVIRPYPIRVGSIVENGETLGYSGDCYDDHHETTWAEVATACGAPEEVMKGELTTVTKRLRRVFTFSDKQLREAASVNGATKIALNFANYIDWSCFGKNTPDHLTPPIRDFIKRIEDVAQIPVTIVGTGPQLDHVIALD